MYKITLHDGTVIDDLGLNGNNFISKAEVEESIFTDKALKSVEVHNSETDATEVLHDVMLIQLAQYGDEYWFILTEKPSYLKRDEEIQKSIDATEEAITELYEMMMGGEA